MLSIMATLVPLTQAGSNIYVFSFKFGGSGSGNGVFQYPIGMAFDASENLYIADQNNHRVQKFDSNGNFIRAFGASYLSSPQGVAVSPSNGYIYVANNYPAQIVKFDSNGNYIGVVTPPSNRATGLAFDSSSNLYLTSWYDNVVYKFSSSDTYISSWGGLNQPYGVAVDHNNNVYVVNSGTSNVKKYDTNGGLLATISSAGSADGQMNYPMYIGVDSNNNIWVSEQNNNRVQKFDSSGNFLARIGGPTSGSSDGQFWAPQGVLVASNGNLYVCDLSGRIQVFTEQALVVTPEAPWGITAMVASIAGVLVFGAVQKTRKVTVYPK